MDLDVENYLDDEDELDIVALVSANANDTSQYLIFEGSNEQFYAKNVSKIEELLVYKDINIVRNNNDSLIIGTADIRGNMTTIIRFDEWFGNEVLDDSEYELIILAYYGGHRLGIVVKRVEYIVSIPSETMTDNSMNDEKSSFLTKVQIGQKDEMCTIFDSDKLLLDVFQTIDAKAMRDTKKSQILNNDRYVLFADDSRFIRKMAEELFVQMDIKYKLYENGQALIDDLKIIPLSEIGIIVTDLEMPILGGREVILKIRENYKFNSINIIVHTNMSNNNMKDTLIENGAQEVIGKVNMLALSEAIRRLVI